MHESVTEQEIAGARAYESLHVPALFGQWCQRMLDAAEVGTGERVLDVACGTGVLARAAMARVGFSGYVAGVDPGRGMLAVARELEPHCHWREGVAEAIPFADHGFDALLCQFGLMFFSDRPQALREMARELRPGGKLALAVWDQLEHMQAYAVLVDILRHLAGEEAAAALSAPFCLGDRDRLMDLIEASPLAVESLTTIPGSAHFPDIRTMVEADLRGWLPVMGVRLSEPQIVSILGEAQMALAEYRDDHGHMVFQVPAHIVTATVH